MSTHDLSIIDISHYQTLIRPEARANLVGVIHKATEGSTMVDGNYAARRELARALGLKWSSYHYLHPGDIDAQMDFYLRNANPEPGSRVCIDYEDTDLELDHLKAAARAIGELDPSLQITVYGGGLLRDQLGDRNDKELGQYALWIAHYTTASEPDWPKGTWPTWSLWQYTDGVNGGSPKSVEGIEGPCDCNVFNGSRENCAKWMGPNSDQPAPGGTVTINIDTPPGIEVVVTVNGEPIDWGF
jgi:lysozyme